MRPDILLSKQDARQADDLTSKRPGFGFWAFWWLIALFSLWLRTGFPTHAIYSAGFDDELFVRGARYLGGGDWLGPYDQVTLAKGIFYPLFIWIAFLLGIPLNIAEQIVYLAASVLGARLVLRLTNDRTLSLLLFAALAFNPVVWHEDLTRVIREALYLSLSLTAVVLSVNAAFPRPTTGRWVTLTPGAALGLVLGAFWLTREEGLWLLPAVAVPVLISVFATVVTGRPIGSAAMTWLKSIGLSLASGVVVFAACNGIVAGLNYARYGVFITNEFKSGPFLRAYGALARIKQDHWRRYVVLPKDARERAYSVSPAASELAAVLDGPLGENWRQISRTATGATDGTDFPGWFMWAFRDAVAVAGHYQSAPEAMRFYEQLAREINSACASGRIPSGPPRATMMPVFRWQYLRDAARDSLTVARVLLTMADMQIGPAPSQGSPAEVDFFADLVGGVYPGNPSQLILQGWVASPSGEPQLTLKSLNGAQTQMTLAEKPEPGVTHSHPGWLTTRFDLRTGCPPSACALVVSAPNVPPVTLSLDRLRTGAALDTPQLRLFFDFASVHPSAPLVAKRLGMQLRIAKAIALGYAWAVPALFVIALFGSILALVRRRSRPIPLALAALLVASFLAIVIRIGLLAYIDVTSFPAATILYASPASPFVIVITVLGCWCFLRCLVSARLRWFGDR